mgnify:CR=1 FL=1
MTPQQRPKRPAKVEKLWVYEAIYKRAAKTAPAIMQLVLALVLWANLAAMGIDIALIKIVSTYPRNMRGKVMSVTSYVIDSSFMTILK